MTLDYDDTITVPLTTDALIEERVGALVGRACRRQLWFLFLDDQRVQLPLIMPFADPPPTPDQSIPDLARLIREVMDDADAASVIVVFERYADASFTDGDRAWAQRIEAEFRAADIDVRCFLVSHRRGVRWFAPDDYRFATDP